VRPERFELPTYCSGGNRSIHLSYGRPTGRFSLHGRVDSINVEISSEPRIFAEPAQTFEHAHGKALPAVARPIVPDV
jgi:hypothetical protein